MTDELRALSSLYFHSQHASAEWIPEAYRPIQPEEAARLLAADASAHGRQRVARAATQLARGIGGPRRDALLALLGVEPEALYGELAAPIAQAQVRLDSVAPFDGAMLEGAPLAPELSVDQVFLDTLALKIEPMVGLAESACVRSFPVSRASFDHGTATTSVHTTITVERPIEELREVFDPQTWDRCSSSFADTHALADPPPTPGSEWSGRLFEAFDLGVGGAELGQFEVLLHIVSSPSADAYRVDYGLDEVLKARFGPLEPQHGPGLSVDDGFLSVRRDADRPERYRCEMLKKVKLFGWGAEADFWMTFCSAFGFWAMSHETYDFVCCAP